MKSVLYIISIIFLCLRLQPCYSQMSVNGQVQLGNEWIDYTKNYFQIKVAKNGIYSITPNQLKEAGININNVQSSQLQLWHNGKEVPLYTSEVNTIDKTKSILFYGEKNTIALDSFIYDNWKTKLLNKEFSMFSDTASYFLVIVQEGTPVKRIQSLQPDYSGVLPTKEKYYFQHKKTVFNNAYYAPTFDGDNKFRYSNFYAIEGFSMGSTDQSTVTLELDEIYSDDPIQATLNMRSGLNSSFNKATILWNDNTLYSVNQFTDFKVIDTSFTLFNTELKGNNTFKIENSGINDRHLLASLEITYPRKYKFNNNGYYELSLPATTKYIEMEGITNDDFELYAYSSAKNAIIQISEKNGNKGLLLENGNAGDIIVFDLKTGVTPVDGIEKISFTKKDFREINYLVVTSKRLIAQNNGDAALNEYLQYRKGKDGESRKIEVVYVEDIYNEFGYGIPNHLYAFKNYNYQLRNTAPKLKFIFLVGKGNEFWDWRLAEIQNKPNNFYIPSYGDYPSDELLFTQKDTVSSGYAIGRLPAKDASQILEYLDKVKQFEEEVFEPYGLESQFWRKNILHLSGGANAAQQELIRNYLSQLEYTINSSMMGSGVSTTAKVNTEPIDGTISERILKSIQEGVYIITFLGHSSPGSWDISIEDPSKWNNHGKNPIVFSLGCYAGNIHTENFNVGENFVMNRDLGAVAFVASTGSAALDIQALYGNEIYTMMGGDLYGGTLGEVLSNLKEKYKNVKERRTYTLNQQFTLLGDPALRLFANKNPDFIPSYSSAKLTPENVSSGDKSFDLSFDIFNLGKNIVDSMNVQIIFENIDRRLIDTFVYRIPTPPSRENYTFTIPNKGINALGKNRLSVMVDYDNAILESPTPVAEKNNEWDNGLGINQYEFYILDNTAFPAYPLPFAIVNKKPILKVSTSNAFAKQAKYIVQIDTSEYFNSPNLVTQNVISSGGTFEVNPGLDIQANTVYYWRVTPDSTDPEIGYLWYNSSFIYLPQGSEGWNQSHFFQFKKNPEGFIFVDDDRKLKFSPRIRTIEINNGLYVNGFIGYKVDYNNPAATISPWRFMNGGIAIAVLDTLRSQHIENSGGAFGSINSSQDGSKRCFAFYTNTPDERKKIIDFINQQIPDGYYVSFFTCYNDAEINLHADEWAADTLIYGNSLINVLKSQGASLVEDLPNHKVIPYNFMFRKNRGILAEAIGQNPEDVINTKFEYTYSGNEGNLLTIPLGPASKWSFVNWDINTEGPEDSTWISVVGVDNNLNETLLIEKTTEKNIDISSIDAKKFPNLKLDFFAKDLVKRTIPKLNHLRIYGDFLPDGSISASENLILPDSVQQGEPLVLNVQIFNYTNYKLDSLLVRYNYVSETNKNYSFQEKIAPLLNGQVLNYRSTINTYELLGNYIFNFEINPDNDQNEAVNFNNLGIKNFKVYPDRINPLLKVTFDGISILDDDLISPTPLIRIEVSDENKYLLLNDPDNIEIVLEYPDLTKKTFTSSDIGYKFTQASSSANNKATIELTPFLKDGDYYLTVQARDNTGNFSGKNKYSVKFKVINQKAVSNVLNYPNPFSTSTRFAFVITGEVPEHIRIQIMTVSGKVVKEITERELGPLKIGTNLTQYTWDGTDDYGNKLANGVYLYKVSFKGNDGKSFDPFKDDPTTSLFDKGFGKMVIMR